MTGLVPFNRKRKDLFDIGFDSFDNMLDDFFVDDWPYRRSLLGDTFKMDVQENDKEYYIEAELPGFSKDEINVEVEDNKLNISANKDEKIEEKEKNYLHRERRRSSMHRSILLKDSSSENIDAKLEDGVLKVTVPKLEKSSNSVKIQVK